MIQIFTATPRLYVEPRRTKCCVQLELAVNLLTRSRCYAVVRMRMALAVSVSLNLRCIQPLMMCYHHRFRTSCMLHLHLHLRRVLNSSHVVHVSHISCVTLGGCRLQLGCSRPWICLDLNEAKPKLMQKQKQGGTTANGTTQSDERRKCDGQNKYTLCVQVWTTATRSS